ncbi:hypothetical protein CapIbe_010008 [Capra ibex]
MVKRDEEKLLRPHTHTKTTLEVTIPYLKKENKLPNYMQQVNAIAGLQDRSSVPHQSASLTSLSENLKLLLTPLSPFSIHKKEEDWL